MSRKKKIATKTTKGNSPWRSQRALRRELRKEGIKEYRATKITKSITWDFKALIFIGFVKSRV